MKLVDIKVETLDIPFKVSFEHSSASRSFTQAILVTAVTKNGQHGLGEGCPRSYVTGESLESAHSFVQTHREDFLSLTSVECLKNWLLLNSDLVDKNPAAFCAVEIALLNALSLDKNTTIEELLSLPKLNGRFHYTGILGSSKVDVFSSQLQQYLKLGFNDFKIKLFGEKSIDSKNINALKSMLAHTIRVRFDANNLWANADDAIRYIQSLDYPSFALEEPLIKGQYKESIKVSKALDSKIILDESFVCEADFNPIMNTEKTWIINIRVSKMGGVLRSLLIANRALELNIPIIIGAQVGETSILSRAALTVANSYRSNLVAQEGAFGTYLLKKDIIEPSIMFGENGCLEI